MPTEWVGLVSDGLKKYEIMQGYDSKTTVYLPILSAIISSLICLPLVISKTLLI